MDPTLTEVSMVPASLRRSVIRRILLPPLAATGVLGVLVANAPNPRGDESQVFSTPRGEAQNVRFELAGSAIVHIDYDLVSSDPRAVFSVTLEASQDGGTTFTMRPQTVSGDVGPNVTPGPGKRISWDSGKDVERMQIDQFRFRIVATAGPLKPGPSDLPRSATGRLTIRTEPAGAQVVVDGIGRGVTPLELNDIAPGGHRVSVKKAGFLENSRLVTVQANSTEIVTVTLTAGSTESVPPGASGNSRGGSRAKWLIPLAAGGGLAAVLGARSGNSAPASATAPSTPAPSGAPPIQCSYVVSPSSFTLGASGGSSQTVSVSTSAGCSWTATSHASFLSITGGGSSMGSDTVVFMVETNTTASNRVGTLSVAGQLVTVTQVASGPDTVSLMGLAPSSGSTVPAGFATGVTATVSYFLGSRDRAFICIYPAFVGSIGGPLADSLAPSVTRGAGIVTIRFYVSENAPNLPVTTTALSIQLSEVLPCGGRPGPFLLNIFESATFTWTRP